MNYGGGGEDTTTKQTSLIIYRNPYTSRNIYWAMPHSNPSGESQTTDVWSCSTMSKGSWYCYQMCVAGFLATPGGWSPLVLNQWLPTGIHRHPHRPQHLHGVLSTLPSHCSILAHVSGQRLAVLFSVCSEVGWLYFPAFLIYCGWFMATLFQITAYPNGDFGRKEMAFQILALSFLTRLRPWRARVPQNELHHLKI